MKVKIQPLHLRQKDKRGKVHDFFLANRKHFLFLYTKKGKVRGCHFHPGLTKSKNPENFILIKGRLRINAIDIITKEMKTYFVPKPSCIRIWPRIYHEIIALEDSILFEPNEGLFTRKDVVKPNDKRFPDFLKVRLNRLRYNQK